MIRIRPFLLTGALATLALCATLPVVFAQTVVIYRCTDAKGALTIQNDKPCPKGSKQERRVMEAAPTSALPAPTPPSSPPAPVAPPAPPAPAPVATPRPVAAPVLPAVPESTIADSDRLPPPWLYECRTYNDDVYFSEVGAPAPRCVSLSTQGLSGVIENNPNASACEMKTDECQRVPDGALCDGWRRRLREAESALQFGAVENRAQAEAEVQRMLRIVRDSTCGMQ